jgi:argininosuccinate lyase
MAKSVKSWQARFQHQTDPGARDFVESISIDKRLYQYDIAGSIAHAQMLCECGLISRAEFRKIRRGLEQIAQKIEQGKFKFDPAFEDIHMVIEAALVAKTGAVGKKLHTGRSRNDQVVLDLRLWMRDRIALLIAQIRQVQAALVEFAGRSGQVVMPGYTHLQRAQPVLAGHYLLAYVEQFERDLLRFADALGRVNVCPLGSGALAGSSLPLNRRRVAELLGFPAVTRNSIDSVSDRDFCIEFVFACAATAMHLSRLAEDWIIFSSSEFGFLRIDDAFCTGSSMMPQKRNPDMLELIRGKTGQIYGNLTALMTIMKGLPLSYNRDMQEDKKQVFAAADTLEASLKMAAAIAANSEFDTARISRDLEAGFLDATSLAEYLVRKGVPFRQAHQIVGQLVQTCERMDIPLAEMPLTEMQKTCSQIGQDVYQYLGAENVAARYATAGAAGLKQLKQQLAFWKKELNHQGTKTRRKTKNKA